MNVNHPSGIIHSQQLGMTYNDGSLSVNVLQGVNLVIEDAQRLAIVGTSGSGKSSLLHLLGGLEMPTEGSVWIDGQEMSGVSDKRRGEIRNKYLGFVYQFHHLLPEFSAVENVALPLLIRGVDRDEAHHKAEQLLIQMNLAKRVMHRPIELSGGERQRAAIARALVTEPACVLADEPTGNLDRKTADSVFETLMQLNADHGTALVIVTHDQTIAERTQNRLLLQDGQLIQA